MTNKGTIKNKYSLFSYKDFLSHLSFQYIHTDGEDERRMYKQMGSEGVTLFYFKVLIFGLLDWVVGTQVFVLLSLIFVYIYPYF